MNAGGGEDHSVAADEGGMRLDAFLSRRLGVSVGAARRLIDAGLVRLDGRRRPKGAPVAAGAQVTVAARPAAPLVAAPGTPAVAVIHEDPSLIAMDKPSGMPSHPLRAGERGTAAQAIVARFPECAAASPDSREGGLGHRLDTATSGVLVAARERGHGTGCGAPWAPPTAASATWPRCGASRPTRVASPRRSGGAGAGVAPCASTAAATRCPPRRSGRCWRAGAGRR